MRRFTSEFPVHGSYRQENQQLSPHEMLSLTHRTKQKAKSCTRGLMHASGDPVVQVVATAGHGMQHHPSAQRVTSDSFLSQAITTLPATRAKNPGCVCHHKPGRQTTHFRYTCKNIIKGHPAQPQRHPVNRRQTQYSQRMASFVGS